MNGRRLDRKTYITGYQLCKFRDGEKCAICGGHIGDMMPAKLIRKWKLTTDKIEGLEIDHIDGNPLNNPPDGTNWRLLCKACNLEMWVRAGGVDREREGEVVGKQTRTSIKKGEETRRQEKVDAEVEEMKREGRELRPATSIVKQQVCYLDGEPTMQVNAFLESAYGKWLVKELDARGFMTWKEALNGGAYVTGGSQLTLKRYLDKLCSLPGPLEEFTADDAGEKLVRFKAKFLELRSEP
jgi:hypothetical protein